MHTCSQPWAPTFRAQRLHAGSTATNANLLCGRESTRCDGPSPDHLPNPRLREALGGRLARTRVRTETVRNSTPSTGRPDSRNKHPREKRIETCVRGGVPGVGSHHGEWVHPPDLPLVAVRNGDDGQPVAELRPCDGGETISEMGLESWTPEEDEAAIEEASLGSVGSSSASQPAQAGTEYPGRDQADQEDSSWETWGATNHGGVVFRVFSPPPQWHAQAFGRQALLPGRTYALTFRGSGSYLAHGYFTADDLASLRPGQVWADDRAMSTKDFDELVEDKC